MTAFRPGQSPPPVRIPIRIDSSFRSRAPSAAASTDNGVVPRSLLLLLAVFAAGVVAGGSGAGRPPALTGSHPCANATGFTCSTLKVPLDHFGRRPGTLALAVAAADNVQAPRG